MKKIYLASTLTASSVVKWMAGSNRANDLETDLRRSKNAVPEMFLQKETIESEADAIGGFGHFLIEQSCPFNG